MKRWTPRMLLLLVLLSGGAIVNVAVAWGIAWTVDFGGLIAMSQLYAVSHREHSHWHVTRTDVRGILRIEASHMETDQIASNVTTSPIEIIPRTWSQLLDEVDYRGFVLEARGWPFVSLWCEYEWDVPQQRWMTRLALGGIDIGPGVAFNSASSDAAKGLPLRLYWPGFAINTVFYAAILFALCFSFAQMRRVARLRRGRCPKCAYDLRGAEHEQCPECGTELRKSVN